MTGLVESGAGLRSARCGDAIGAVGSRPSRSTRPNASAVPGGRARRCSSIAAEHPVVVVLDDLHWADAPTTCAPAARGHHAGERPAAGDRAPTGTPTIAAGHPMADLLAQLHREAGIDRVALRGLDDDDVVALFETFAGHDLDDDGGRRCATRCARETDGNPFFTVEILRHLSETGAITQDDDGPMGGHHRPGRPRPARPRSARSPASASPASAPTPNGSCAWPSVIGRDFDLGVLAEVADLDEDRLLDLLEPARGHHAHRRRSAPARFTVRPCPGRAHALRGALRHSAIPRPPGRRRSHRSSQPPAISGAVLASWPTTGLPPPAPPTPPGPSTYARQAGDYALATLAPEEAARWYRRGPRPPRRPPPRRRRPRRPARTAAAARRARHGPNVTRQTPRTAPRSSTPATGRRHRRHRHARTRRCSPPTGAAPTNHGGARTPISWACSSERSRPPTASTPPGGRSCSPPSAPRSASTIRAERSTSPARPWRSSPRSAMTTPSRRPQTAPNAADPPGHTRRAPRLGPHRPARPRPGAGDASPGAAPATRRSWRCSGRTRRVRRLIEQSSGSSSIRPAIPCCGGSSAPPDVNRLMIAGELETRSGSGGVRSPRARRREHPTPCSATAAPCACCATCRADSPRCSISSPMSIATSRTSSPCEPVTRCA